MNAKHTYRVYSLNHKIHFKESVVERFYIYKLSSGIFNYGVVQQHL